MKKSVLFLMSAALLFGSNVMADDQPQVPNGDFETWTFDGDKLPNNWNSFDTDDGMFSSFSSGQVKRSTDVHTGSKGQYSCSIWSTKIMGQNAQGNLTSGRVHAGSMSATNKENYNYTDRDGSTTKGDVTNPCAMKFTGKPTAVRVWVKYVQAGKTADYGEHATAKFSAIIHDDADYISYGLPENDTPENKALVVASAVKEINYNGGEWEELIIPFKYTNNDAKPAYIQINASTNAYPGAGVQGDFLYIDDIEMVYPEPESEPKVFDKDKLYVTVDGEKSGPYDATVYVTENADMTINFQLKNFVLLNEDPVSHEVNPMPVGNINVNNIPTTKESGITSFSDNQVIMIEEGDDPAYEGMWAGPMLSEVYGGIPLTLSGKYNDEHLYVSISISIGMQIDVELGNEGDVTGIGAVKASAPKAQATKGVIYDLNGRKVSEMQRGRFYIVDGKIVMN